MISVPLRGKHQSPKASGPRLERSSAGGGSPPAPKGCAPCASFEARAPASAGCPRRRKPRWAVLAGKGLPAIPQAWESCLNGLGGALAPSRGSGGPWTPRQWSGGQAGPAGGLPGGNAQRCPRSPPAGRACPPRNGTLGCAYPRLPLTQPVGKTRVKSRSLGTQAGHRAVFQI